MAGENQTVPNVVVYGTADVNQARELTEQEKQQLKNKDTGTSAATATADATQDRKQNTAAKSASADDATSSGGATTTSANDPNTPVKTTDPTSRQDPVVKVTPTPNPLHDFATYTYNLGLYALTKDDYQALSEGRSWKPLYNLIQSGGGKGIAQERNPLFKDDFYFDGLKLNTVVGMSSTTRASNAIEINFSLIEPYGMTLLDRLLELAKDPKMGAKNHLAIPYLLSVEFFGYDDQGQAKKLEKQRKFIPIKLVGMKMRVSTRGTEYQIQAIPFSHQAFSESVISTPVNIISVAKTLDEFFGDASGTVSSLTSGAAGKDNNAQRDPPKGADGKPVANTADDNPGSAKKVSDQVSKYKPGDSITASSFSNAINAFNRHLVNTGAKTSTDEIYFNISDEFRGSKIVDEKRQKPGDTPAPNPGTKEATDVRKNNAKGPDLKAGQFPVNAGTSIMAVIDQVMKNSEYITSQMTVPEKDGSNAVDNKDTKTPLKWYKVIPQVILKDFDEKNKDWSKKIIFHVKPYTVANSKHPYGPQSEPPGPNKTYDYIYTGKNNDIIDFQLDFDTMFFTAVTVDRPKVEPTRGTAAQDEEAAEGKSKNNYIPKTKSTEPLQPQQLKFKPGDQQNSSMGGQTSAAVIVAGDIANNLYSGARGDMINVKLKIIGDPEYIKQDDVYTNPGQPNYVHKSGVDEKTGSMMTDASEVYVNLAFNVPVDLDPETGQMRFDSNLPSTAGMKQTVFSGLYRVLTVESEFRGGKFEQTLDLIKAFKPPETEKDNQRTDGPKKNRDQTTAEKQASESDKTTQDNTASGAVTTTKRSTPEDNTAPASSASKSARDRAYEQQQAYLDAQEQQALKKIADAKASRTIDQQNKVIVQ